jgi:alpha-tubulin suppressor-like RCC1 family protein
MTSLNNVYNLTTPNMKYDVFIDAYVNNNADYSICSNLSIMSTRIKNKYLNKNTVFAINDYSGTIYNNNILYTYMSKLKIVQVACGWTHTLLLENSGKVIAFGDNRKGQLGINSDNFNSLIPTYVVKNIQNDKLDNIIQISAGGNSSHGFSLFLENKGNVFACGYNNYGQLGQNSLVSVKIPANVVKNNTGTVLLDNIIQISAGGSHSLFLENTGKVLVCGSNNYGQLGIQSGTYYTCAVYVLLDNIVQITAGDNHSLFLENTGKVLACGYNIYGQLGNNQSGIGTDKSIPVNVLKDTTNALDNIVQITAGDNHSLFLENTGRVLACGYNIYGQLGNNQSGTETNKSIPVNVLKDSTNLLINIINIEGGGNFSLFLQNTSTSNVLGCGLDYSEVANIININEHNTFQGQNYAYYYNNSFSNNNIVLEATPYNNTIIEYSSNLVCYGHNYLEMYGNTRLLGGVLKIETGAMHSIFLRNDYKVYSCGNNFFGQLGTNNNIKYYQPRAMSGTNNNIIIDISSGAYHNLLLTSNNSVFSCGRNNYGQLGLNDNTNRTTLTKISISDIINIKCGENHSVFLNYSGNVYSCGLNQYGQLSTSNTTNYLIPAQVMSINGTEPIISNIVIRDIACGKNHTIMLGIDKTVYTVGNNNNNQLGISYSDLPFSIYPRICFSYFLNYDLKIYSNAFIDKTYILLIV